MSETSPSSLEAAPVETATVLATNPNLTGATSTSAGRAVFEPVDSGYAATAPLAVCCELIAAGQAVPFTPEDEKTLTNYAARIIATPGYSSNGVNPGDSIIIRVPELKGSTTRLHGIKLQFDENGIGVCGKELALILFQIHPGEIVIDPDAVETDAGDVDPLIETDETVVKTVNDIWDAGIALATANNVPTDGLVCIDGAICVPTGALSTQPLTDYIATRDAAVADGLELVGNSVATGLGDDTPPAPIFASELPLSPEDPRPVVEVIEDTLDVLNETAVAKAVEPSEELIALLGNDPAKVLGQNGIATIEEAICLPEDALVALKGVGKLSRKRLAEERDRRLGTSDAAVVDKAGDTE